MSGSYFYLQAAKEMQRVAFAFEAVGLDACDSELGKVQRVVRGVLPEGGVAINGDGRRILLYKDGAQIKWHYLQATEFDKAVGGVFGSEYRSGLCVSPNGKNVAYVTGAGETVRAFVDNDTGEGHIGVEATPDKMMVRNDGRVVWSSGNLINTWTPGEEEPSMATYAPELAELWEGIPYHLEKEVAVPPSSYVLKNVCFGSDAVSTYAPAQSPIELAGARFCVAVPGMVRGETWYGVTWSGTQLQIKSEGNDGTYTSVALEEDITGCFVFYNSKMVPYVGVEQATTVQFFTWGLIGSFGVIGNAVAYKEIATTRVVDRPLVWLRPEWRAASQALNVNAATSPMEEVVAIQSALRDSCVETEEGERRLRAVAEGKRLEFGFIVWRFGQTEPIGRAWEFNDQIEAIAYSPFLRHLAVLSGNDVRVCALTAQGERVDHGAFKTENCKPSVMIWEGKCLLWRSKVGFVSVWDSKRPECEAQAAEMLLQTVPRLWFGKPLFTVGSYHFAPTTAVFELFAKGKPSEAVVHDASLPKIRLEGAQHLVPLNRWVDRAWAAIVIKDQRVLALATNAVGEPSEVTISRSGGTSRIVMLGRQPYLWWHLENCVRVWPITWAGGFGKMMEASW